MTDSPTKSLKSLQQKAERLQAQKQWQELEFLCRQALKLYPNIAQFHHCLGNALLESHRFQEAISVYQNAIALPDVGVWSYYNLAQAHAQLKQWSAAIKTYQNALKFQPDHLESARKLLNFFPDRLELYLIVTQAFLKQNNRDQALVVCRMGLEIQPNYQPLLRLENQLLKGDR